MKKLLLLIFLLPALCKAQNVNLSGAIVGSYPDLATAFTAINTGGGSGSVLATIIANTTEAGTAQLNQTSYSVRIIPSGNIIVGGNFNAALIKLNSADNVTFDGLALTGLNTLILRNNNTGASANVFSFSDSATVDTIKNCTIEGASNTTAVTGGVINFVATPTGGNSNNVIENNLIKPVAAGSVNYGIVFTQDVGTTTTTHNNNIVFNNQFENIFINSVSSAAIYLHRNSLATVIKGNSFYYTGTYSNTVDGTTMSAILVNQTASTGGGVTIDSNFVGGTATACGGTKMTISSPANKMTTDFISVTDLAASLNPISVTRNIIRNISVTVGNTAVGALNLFRVIRIPAGNLGALNNNSVGDAANSSITLNITQSSTGAIGNFAIIAQVPCNTPIADNFVGGIDITATGAGSGATSFTSIDNRTAISTVVMKKNIIGSATANNISITNNVAAAFNFNGLAVSAPAVISTITIDTNIVRNITATNTLVTPLVFSNSTTAATAVSANIRANTFSDIAVSGTSLSTIFGINYTISGPVTGLVQTIDIQNNTFNNISSSSGTDHRIDVVSIANASASANRIRGKISKNTISNITNNSTGTTASRTRGIVVRNAVVAADNLVIDSNAINNLSNSGSVVFATNDLANTLGIMVTPLTATGNGSTIVRDNILHTITAASSSGATRSWGISVLSKNAVIERNKIYAIDNSSTTTTANADGIVLSAAGAETETALVKNNMIAINNSSATRVTGIKSADATAVANIYHNSVLLEGSSATNSYTLYNAASSTLDVRNNILYNARTGAGSSFAVGLQTAGYTGNNNYLVSNSLSTIGQVAATGYNFAGWQTAVSADGGSQSEQAGVTTISSDLFTDKTIADLFINTGNSFESIRVSNNGVPLSGPVPFDFLGTARSVSAPDMGAHEFIFNPLPVKIIQFTAAKNNSGAVINWLSANEINVNYFTVEKSYDGITFVKIADVSANNHSVNNNYSATDRNPFVNHSIVYYRLKSVDKNDQFMYSSVIKLSGEVQKSLNVYPNPAKDMVTISGLENNGLLKLSDASGRILQQQKVNANTLLFDMRNYGVGIYLLQYSNKEKITEYKIIKQ